MKVYPLSRTTNIHVYVAETNLITPDNDIFEQVHENASAEAEYEFTGEHVRDNYEALAKDLVEFIHPYACRRSLNILFVKLGIEILKDLERIKDMPPLDSKQSKNSKKKFKEQYQLLLKFLDEFEQV